MKLAISFIVLFSFQVFGASRPNLKIKVQDSFVCKYGKSQGGKIYSRFCKARNYRNTNLFVHTSPSSEIIFGELMSSDGNLKGNLYSWCTREISDGRLGPSCVLEVTNIKTRNREQLTINILKDSNFASVNVSSLPIGVRFNARIIETGSGSNASTEIFELVVR